MIFDLDYEKLPKPPEVDLPRQNDGGAVTATTVLLGVLGATILVAYVIQRLTVKNLRDCKDLTETQSSLLEGIQKGISTAVSSGASPDTVIDLIDGMSVEIDPQILEEMRKGCPAKMVPGMGVLKSLQQKFPRQGSEAQKREFLQTSALFMAEESKALQKTATIIENRIEEEKKEDPLGSLFNTFSSVIEYAGYAALALGVLWGAGKVYKALKSED